MTGRRARHLRIAYAAVLAPPLIVAIVVATHAVNVPVWDQIAFAELLARDRLGLLTFGDLAAQQNEHRLFFPRLLMLALARMNGWNIVHEQLANVALAGLTFAVLAHTIATTAGRISPRAGRLLLVPVSLLVFSLVQSENWTFGYGMLIVMNVLGAAVAARSLTLWPGEWRGLLLGYAGVAVSAFSFANGLAAALLAPVAVAVNDGKRVRPLLAAAIAASLAVFAAFFHGHRPVAHHPGISGAVAHPLECAGFVLAWLGSPVAPGRHAAIAAGFGGVVLFAVAAALIWRRPRHRAAALPWLFLAAYAILSAAATALGRSGFGIRAAMEARYTTISTLFWIGTTALWGVAFAASPRRRFGPLAAAVAALVLAGYVSGYVKGARKISRDHARNLALKECFINYRTAGDDCLRRIHPYPWYVRNVAEALDRMRLGPFADRAPTTSRP